MFVGFLGTYTPRLDDKGRLILPAKYRARLAEGLIITKGQERCLFVYPPEEFALIAGELRQGASSTRAARDHRDAEAMTGREHRGDLHLVFRQGDDERLLAIGREAIALVGRGVLAVPEQGVRRQDGTERGDDLFLPTRPFDVRLGCQQGGDRSRGVHRPATLSASTPRRASSPLSAGPGSCRRHPPRRPRPRPSRRRPSPVPPQRSGTSPSLYRAIA